MKHLSDFIVFSDDWGRHPSSCQHLMRRFLSENRILWVNSIGLRSPQISRYDLLRGFHKLASWMRPQQEPEKNLKIISLFSFPWNQFSSVRSWNKQIGFRALEKAIAKAGVEKPISLATVPNACDWMGRFGERLKIYYCVDDFSQWPGMNRKTILEMEKSLLGKIDLFVATSEKLYAEKKPKGIPSLLLPHGVDVKHFEQARSSFNEKEKKEWAPTIGYFGLMDERLDFDLITSLVTQRPHWKWVFLGPTQFFPRQLKEKKNVICRPSVEYSVLPEHLKAIDILFLPYKINSLTQALNPLKLRECLATGKPVVSVPLPEVTPYAEWVQIGKDSQQILASLDQLVLNYFQWNSQKQIQRVAKEDWEMRAKTLADQIEALL